MINHATTTTRLPLRVSSEDESQLLVRVLVSDDRICDVHVTEQLPIKALRVTTKHLCKATVISD